MEWTEEAAYANDALESYMRRGSSFGDSYTIKPTCYRVSYKKTGTATNNGFRPALYIK